MTGIEPVILRGAGVRLEPLSLDHAAALFEIGRCAADWAWMPRPCFGDAADARHWVGEALAEPGQLPFAIISEAEGVVAGSTRYLNLRPEHRGLEIGWTWLGSAWLRSRVNTETKLLLLTHAFEVLDCIRVEFKTDARNLRSQQALARIGAVREGVLRNHMIVQGGYYRDSVYFSIVNGEWPAVRERLQQLLNRH